MGNGWSQRWGQGLDIAVINNNQMYVIGMDQRVYRWTGYGWDAIGSNTKSISAASDGTVAVVNSQVGTIWVKTGYNDYTNWQMVPYVSGATRVAIVQYGWLHFIGSDGTIYYSDMVHQPVAMGRFGVEISAGPDGSLVCVNTANQVWSHTGAKNVASWVQVPGTANAVATHNSNTILTVGSGGTFNLCAHS
jgi:hypothetical protein